MLNDTFFAIDLPAIITVCLTGFSCALLGSFLVIREEAMSVDALSHVVLPGIVVGFLISGSLHSPLIFASALGICLLSLAAIWALQSLFNVQKDVAIGLVMTSFFALGIFLLEAFVDSKVHLDTTHAFYGALELIYWPSPQNLSTLPGTIIALGLISLINLLFCVVFFRYLRGISFDPLYMRTLGKNLFWPQSFFFTLVVLTAVAAFEAMGSILVLALFICPPAAARMICDDLKSQLFWSVFFGMISAVLGYFLSIAMPLAIGFEHTISASGMIAVTAGMIQFLAMLFAPRYGYLKTLNLYS